MIDKGIASAKNPKLNGPNVWQWAESKLPLSPISELLQRLDWDTVYTIEEKPAQFQRLIKERPFLMAQYRIQTAHLIQLSKQTHKYDPKLREEIDKTLRMTVLLKKIYEYIDEPDDVMRAEIDITILDTILHRIRNPKLQHLSTIPKCNAGFSHNLRGIHLGSNLSRLTAIRTRRLILALTTLQAFGSWRSTVAKIEYFTAPFFLYLGWMFFLPRFALNLTTVLKKGFCPKQNKLPWHLRIEAYLNLHRRLYELWTDTVWFISGILLCFTLFGPLALWRPIAIIAVQVSDTVMMMTRSFFEIRRHLILKKEYHQGIKSGDLKDNPSYLQALEERLAFEKKVSYLVITNNLLMVIALLTLLPSVALINPLLPVIGATIGLLTTFRFYVYNAANDAAQPKTNLNLLLKNYDPSASSEAASVPRNLLLSRLSVPAILTLSPIIFVAYTMNPLLTALFCVSLVAIAARKIQQPELVVEARKRYETLMNHHFFKSRDVVKQPIEPRESNRHVLTP